VRTLTFRALARLAIVVILAAGLLVPGGSAALAATDPYLSTSVGYDLSYPDCSKVIGPTASSGKAYAFAVMGVNDGKPFTANGCLAGEYHAAVANGLSPSLYMNTAAPIGSTAKTYENLGPKTCAKADKVCLAYNYGYQMATAAHASAASQAATSSTWWLDVETANSWTRDLSENTATLQGAIDALTALGIANVGVYSTPSEWTTITGNAQLGVPVWVAGALSLDTANQFCTASFTGGAVWLVQSFNASRGYDEDYAC
jgi:hypothetical protein